MPSIREWPVSTRPRERLLDRGAAASFDEELLAILIGSGRCTTRDAIAAGVLLGVRVLDHIVFGAGRWVSLRSAGIAFGPAALR